MGFFGKMTRSADLACGMAKRVGADLTGHLDLSAETAAVELRRIVLRCSACPDQDACARLQAENDVLTEAPEYCQNAHLMQRRA